MLGEIGEQYRQIEADLLRWLVETVHESNVVDFAIVIRLAAGQEKFNFLAETF